MNFGQIQARLNLGVLRTDLAPNYGEYVNEALMDIQNRFSWTFMKVTEQVAVGPGPGWNTATLQSNFKELRRDPAINFIADDGGMIPATTVFAEEEVWRIWAWGGAPIFIWPPRVFLIRGASAAKVGIATPLIEQFNLSVNMFAYLPPLVEDTDTSPFITAYPNMVLYKAKALALMDINDPESDKAELAFERYYGTAKKQDAYSEVAGRRLRM